MIIRDIEPHDLVKIKELSDKEKSFKLNNIDNCIIDKIVYYGDELVAYGIVKRIGEAILLTNPDIPLTRRAIAMRELMKYAEMGARRDRCMQLQCFVSDEKLAETLESHFGFVRSKDIVLVKNL